MEQTVSGNFLYNNVIGNKGIEQMAEYYKTRPSAIATTNGSTRDSSSTSDTRRTLSEFDKHREKLLSDDSEEGWASELRRYLGEMPRDVEKNTDIVEWWQVRT